MNLACITTEGELEAIFKAKEFNQNTDSVILLNPDLQETAFERKINFFTPKGIVSEQQRKAILKKSVSLATTIEKIRIEYKGVSLVKAKSYELNRDIYNGLFEIIALKNACKKFLPKQIIACRNTKAEEYLRILGKNAFLFDSAEAKDSRFVMAHLKKRGRQISGKLFEIIRSSFRKNKPNAITVFTKSRGYFDGLQKKLEESHDFNVFSMEESLLRYALRPGAWFNRKKMPQKITAKAKNAFDSKAIKSESVFEKTNFFPMVRKQIEDSIKNDFPRFVQFIDIIEKEFIEKKPRLVVLWVDSVPFERIVALMAKKFPATSIVIEHGIPSIDRTAKVGWLTGFVPLTSDLFFAWGKNTGKLLKFHKIPNEKIFETGNPRFDEIRAKKFSKEKTRQKLGAKENEKIVLVLTQPFFYGLNPVEMARETVKAIEKIPNTKCVIKIHPTEHAYVYEKRFKRPIVTISKEIPLYELLNCAEIIVSNSSTTLVEAMLFEKPVIVFDSQGTDNVYKKNPAVVCTKNQGELKNAIIKTIEDKRTRLALEKGRKKFLADELAFSEKSSERVIELLKKIAGEKKKQGSGNFINSGTTCFRFENN